MVRRYVIMGVAGSGKSLVGKMLADAIGAIYVDGDDLHTAANIDKMARGEPLDDDDRWPWLDRVGEVLRNAPGTIIVGCSALKRRYRDRIRDRAISPVTFLYLAGDRDLIARRMRERQGHFMPTSLLDSQFATLEPPDAREDAITVPIEREPAQIVEGLKAAIALRG